MTAVRHDLTAAAHAVDARRARSKQKKIGPSAVGGCRRRTAYQVAGVAPTDDDGPRMKAILGTWLHKGALDALRREYGALIELTVQSEAMKGHVDAVYVDHPTPGTATGLVEDVKTEGLHPFEWRSTHGARPAHLFQVHLYAWHLREGWYPAATRRKLGDVDHVDVTDVRVRYVCRDDGREHVEERPYDPDITAQALEWMADVYEAVDSPMGPDKAPRDHDGPGLDPVCDGCVFRTACWGPERVDGTARQANLVRDDADVEQALADYNRGRELASEGERVKKLARKMLDASEPGRYGPFELSWSGGRPKDVDDLQAVGKILAELGLDWPTRQTTTSMSIGVKRARSDA